jgi:streptogramin lyase
LVDSPTGGAGLAINRRGDAVRVGEGYSLVRGAGCDSGPAGPGSPGTDECVAWSHALEAGVLFAPAWRDVCGRDDLRAWVTLDFKSGIEVWLLDTADGSVVEVIDVPGEFLRGPVLGVADAGGNYWILPQESELRRIDAVDHTVRTITVPERIGEDYVGNSFDSLTIDRDGYIYACDRAVKRFDPIAETWDAAWVEPRDEVDSSHRGCIADPDRDVLWVIVSLNVDELAAVDRTTLQTVDWIKADGAYAVTVDDDGMLWVARSTELARIDPATHEKIDSFGKDESGFEYLSSTANDFSGRTSLAAGVR